jgi:hypothetical protein
LHKTTAVILIGGQEPDPETLEKVNEEGIPIPMRLKSTVDLAGQIRSAGVIKAGS